MPEYWELHFLSFLLSQEEQVEHAGTTGWTSWNNKKDT